MVAVPLAAIFWPAVQVVHAVQENALAVVEYVPAPQEVQARSVLLVPLEPIFSPATQFVKSVQ